MKKAEKSKVIVVGAGISGSYLSYILASNGIDVTIIEKSKDFKIDSGIVSNRIFNFIKIEENLIKQKIKKITFCFGSYDFSINSKKPFAIILNRKNFGRYLREKAIDSGAKIIFDEIIGLRIRNKEIEAIGIKNRYRGKLIVGADGANSIIRKCLGISSPKLYLGFLCNYKAKNKNRNENIFVFHNKRYSKRFFAWRIEASKELGMITELVDCKKSIDNFISDIKKENEIIVKERYYHLIPFGTTKSYGARSILLGDACGQVKPLTGGGIIYSLICAEKAFEVIKDFLEKEDEKIIKNYETLWKKEIGKEIWLQKKLRDLYERLDQNSLEILARKIKDLYFEELDYDSSFDIINKILLQTSKIDLVKTFLLFFKYLFC
ncbi:MAG: NAD(P)/FAD-dependent oxidoreductase [Candidatus Aenigmatarchaeota archaeon]